MRQNRQNRYLEHYLEDCEPLSRQEELKLFIQDPIDINTIIKHNLRLVYKVALRYYSISRNYNKTFDEFFNAGCLGLYKAIYKFDITRKCRFGSYAYYWIRCYILKEIKITTIKGDYQIVKNDNNYKQAMNNNCKAPIESIEEDITEQVSYNDLKELLSAMLTDEDKELFQLHFIDGLTGTEISKLQNVSRQTLHYKITRIKNCIKELCPESILELYSIDSYK